MLRYLAIFSVFLALTSVHGDLYWNFEWKYINYTWPSPDTYLAAKNDGSYIEKNNIIKGLAVWRESRRLEGNIYLSIPRYKKGVPVTLAMTDEFWHAKRTGLLQPYPNWNMQEIGNCSAFQNVLNMEIDPKGRMWVVDTGRIETMTSAPQNLCPPKLVILDTKNNGTILRSYVFPTDVVNYNSSTLEDIVIDHEYGGMAYISDSDEFNPGLVVYSLTNNTSWRIQHSSMRYDPKAIDLEYMNLTTKGNINAITLSPAVTEKGNRVLYFSPLSSFNLYTVNTQAIIDAQYYKQGEERENEIHKSIKNFAHMAAQTPTLLMSNTGKLYFSLASTIWMWDSMAENSSFYKDNKPISRDREILDWISKFAFDGNGQLWCVVNNFHLFANDSLDIDRVNFRVVGFLLEEGNSMRNYQYYENKKAPQLPHIKANIGSQS